MILFDTSTRTISRIYKIRFRGLHFHFIYNRKVTVSFDYKPIDLTEAFSMDKLIIICQIGFDQIKNKFFALCCIKHFQ
jgi:hypothetical protein